METGEDFWLWYFDGTTWQKVGIWVCGTDFSNGTFYPVTLYVNEAQYTFPTNMQFVFECSASDNTDDVYIDEIKVSAQ